MATDSASKAPGWFFIIAILGLVWNVAGIANFVSQINMSPETLSMLSAEDHALITNRPGWATGAFGVAVFAGALGCLLMLMRKSVSSTLLQVSLAGVLVTMFHALFMTRASELDGAAGLTMPVVVIVVAAFLALIAVKANSQGWIS